MNREIKFRAWNEQPGSQEKHLPDLGQQPTPGSADTHAAKRYTEAVEAVVKELRRLASPDEMAGMGVTEEMTGPAASEMRLRMMAAGRIADELPAAINLAVLEYLEGLVGEDEHGSDVASILRAGDRNKLRQQILDTARRELTHE